VRQWGHRELSTFGIGSGLSENEWRAVFRQMIALGLLAADPAHGALRLTAASRPVLRGEQKIALRRAAEKRKAAAPRSRTVDAALEAGERALWERLRAWRAETARAHGVPAFVILHDSTLLEIVRTRPRNAAQLRAISGIGARKLENYGETLLGILS